MSVVNSPTITITVTGPSPPPSPPSPPPITGTNIIIPEYNSPGDSSYTTIMNSALANKNLTYLAVINPSNGPIPAGSATDYIDMMGTFPSNVLWAGYCDAATGSNSISDIEGLVNEYLSWFPAPNKQLFSWMFFDDFDFSNNASYASALSSYCHGLGLKTVANPGNTNVTAGTGMDLWCVYEECQSSLSNVNLPSVLPASQQCFIAFGLPASTTQAQITSFLQVHASDFAFVNIGVIGECGVCGCANFADNPYAQGSLATQFVPQMAVALG